MAVRIRYRRGFALIAAVGTAAIAGGVAYAQWWVPAETENVQALAARMPTGNRPTATSSGSTVTVSWPANVLPGAKISGYQVARYDDAGIPTPATGNCAKVVTGTSCVESDVPDGIWRFSVRPARGTAWTGPESATSNPVTVATVSVRFPADRGEYSLNQFLTGCGSQNKGQLCGRVVAGTGRTIAALSASLRHSTGRYWSAASKAFDSETESLIPLAWDTSDWYLPFAPTNFPFAGRYTIRVKVADSAGRTSTATATFKVNWSPPTPRSVLAPPVVTPAFPGAVTNRTGARFALTGAPPSAGYQCFLDDKPLTGCTSSPAVGPPTGDALSEGSHRFAAKIVDGTGRTSDPTTFVWTVDTTAPRALDVQGENGGSPGRLDAGDTLGYVFSEALRPESVLPGWSGAEPATVSVRLTAAAASTASPAAGGGSTAASGDTLTVFGKPDGVRLAALGTVNLGGSGYTTRDVTIRATLTIRGSTIVLTIVDPGGTTSQAVNKAGTLSWCSDGGLDRAGNPLGNSGSWVNEIVKREADIDF